MWAQLCISRYWRHNQDNEEVIRKKEIVCLVGFALLLLLFLVCFFVFDQMSKHQFS